MIADSPDEGPKAGGSEPALDPATGAFAVRFARLYLAAPGSSELASLFAPGAAPAGSASNGGGNPVAQAEVAGVRGLGDGQSVVTVACQLDDGRVLYTAVPIVRASAGEVAASGAPSFVAGPAVTGVSIDSPRPLAGADAEAIADLARRFLPTYFSAASPADLSYLVAPGAVVSPPSGGLRLLSTQGVKQIGSAEGGQRSLVVAVRVRDPESGEVYELGYRLEVVRRGRWYVERVAGALS